MLPLFTYVVAEIMDISVVESLHYDFHTIRVATNDFSENKKLGQGGFGSVYKVSGKHTTLITMCQMTILESHAF